MLGLPLQGPEPTTAGTAPLVASTSDMVTPNGKAFPRQQVRKTKCTCCQSTAPPCIGSCTSQPPMCMHACTACRRAFRCRCHRTGSPMWPRACMHACPRLLLFCVARPRLSLSHALHLSAALPTVSERHAHDRWHAERRSGRGA